MSKCGAKTRSGGVCKRHAVKGGKRCKLHGGKSTGAGNPERPNNKNAAKPGGLYSQYLTPDEQAAYDALELGRVDDELRLTRIRLARALKAEQDSNGEPELDERIENDGGGDYVAAETRKFKARDYVSLIDKLTARIESLERTRKLLDPNPDGGGDKKDISGFEAVPYDE